MFTEEELAGFHGVMQVTSEMVEIDCGCTNPRYGDTPGKLRVFSDGRLLVDCDCRRPGCHMVGVSPVEFAKHAGKVNAHGHWRSHIWVFAKDGHKIGVRRTCLLKHHTHTFRRPLRQVTHRDEFIRCSTCHKDRRFSLRSKQDCKIYHDALLNPHWTCSHASLRCSDAEERESRKVNRGCPRASKCAGCEQCVCLGCELCRFETCICHLCVDFIINF